MLTSNRQYGNDNNYCHFEYKLSTEFFDSDQKIYLSAQPRDDINAYRNEIPPDYDDWITEILEKDLIQIPSTRNHNPDSIDDILKNLKKNLISKMFLIKNKMYTVVPD